MPTIRLRHFSRPTTIRSIDPKRLHCLLKPHAPFFEQRGLKLPPSSDAAEIDYDSLVEILAKPDRDTPPELVDALCLIEEMSSAEAIEQLLGVVSLTDVGLPAEGDHSPADIAVGAWLAQREVVEQIHAKQRIVRPKSFEYFQSKCAEPPFFELPSAASVRHLERDLDSWFAERSRGRGTRVFVFSEDREVHFLIRHGHLYRREECIEEGRFASVNYRPVRNDVVIYDRMLGELRINAQLKSEKEHYRRLIGKHFFGDKDFFPNATKYTLEPLREYGLASTSCGDIDGVESVTLAEIQMLIDGERREVMIHKADDLFEALESRQRDIPQEPRLLSAVLKVKLAGCRRPRSVTVRPPNVALYTRDSDAETIEALLLQRGFIEPVVALVA